MKLIYEPKVYIVGQLRADQHELGNFLRGHGVENWDTDAVHDPELLCEVAGRLCYMSFGKPRPGGNQVYLERILSSKHGSVTEHAVWNFIVTGVSRTLTHELVRHRAGWGYSQLSQRYVDESVAEFVVPHDLRNEVSAAEQWLNERKRSSDWVTDAQDALQEIAECKIKHPGYATCTGLEWIRSVQRDSASYKQMVKYLYEKISREKYESFVAVESKKETDVGDKVLIPSMEQWTAELTQDDKTEIRKGARQAARSVLPNCTETKIFCTANARAIRHFLEMRASRHAEPEIRKMAYQLWQKIAPQAMNLFGDYSATKLRDDTYELTTPHVKV